MQGREFSEQFIRQVCTDVLRGKSQTRDFNTIHISKVKQILFRNFKSCKSDKEENKGHL